MKETIAVHSHLDLAAHQLNSGPTRGEHLFDERKNMIAVAIFFWGIAGLFSLLLFDDFIFSDKHSLGTDFVYVVVGIICWLATIMLFWFQSQKRRDWFEIPVLFTIVLFGQGPVNIWLNQRDYLPTGPWFSENNVSSSAVTVTLLTGFALSVMWIGYAVGLRGLKGKSNNWLAPWTKRTLRMERVVQTWVIAWITSTAVTFAGYSGYLSAENTVWTQYISFVRSLSFLSGFILASRHFKNPTLSGWLWIFIWIIVEVLSGMVLGTKSAALIMVYLAIIYFYTHRRFNLWLIVAGVIVIAITVSVSYAFRQRLVEVSRDKQNNLSITGRLELLDDAVNQVLSQPILESLQYSEEKINRRQGGSFVVASAIVNAHPNPMPYEGAEIMEHTWNNLLPRIVWPFKTEGHPRIYKVAEVYLGYPEGLSLATPGHVGDAYRAGGTGSIVVYSFLLGLFFAWVYHQGPLSKSEAGLSLYVVILIYFAFQDGNVFRTLFFIYRNLPALAIFLTLFLTKPQEFENRVAEPRVEH